MLKKRLIVLVIFISVSIFALIFSITYKQQEKVIPNVYSLKAYENNIALYKNDEILEIYNEIVLNSLPKYDQETFKKGIIVSEISKVKEILEDYE